MKRQTSFDLQAKSVHKIGGLQYVTTPNIKLRPFITFYMKFKEPRELDIWCKSIREQWI